MTDSEHNPSGQLIAGQRLSGKVGDLESREFDQFGSRCRLLVLTSNDVFFAGKDQVDHPDQICFEFCLVIRIAPRCVTASAFDFSKVAKLTRSCHENFVNKDGWVTLHAKLFCQLGSAEIFADEGDLTGILRGNFLYQQTCWVGNVSSVGPSNESESDGFARCAVDVGCRLLSREVRG